MAVPDGSRFHHHSPVFWARPTPGKTLHRTITAWTDVALTAEQVASSKDAPRDWWLWKFASQLQPHSSCSLLFIHYSSLCYFCDKALHRAQKGWACLYTPTTIVWRGHRQGRTVKAALCRVYCQHAVAAHMLQNHQCGCTAVCLIYCCGGAGRVRLC